VQVIVPKRTALLLDRIMAALQKAVEDDKGGPNFAPDPAENKVRGYVTCTTRHDFRYCLAGRLDSARSQNTFGALKYPLTDSVSADRCNRYS
jgi:hypothetical protein